MRVVFIGPPGAGKGTQARSVVERLGIPHISSGELLRNAKADGSELGALAAKYIDEGRLVPDDVMTAIIGARLGNSDCDQGYLLDGFPRTVNQAESLDEMLELQGRKLDVVLELQCDDDELVSRLAQRATAESRVDDTPETFARRQQTYRRDTEPVLDYYRENGLLKAVNAMQSRDEVFTEIWRILEAESG